MRLLFAVLWCAATAFGGNEIQIAAHRGGYENDKADQAPENSVANIRVCEKRGYQLYETDIQRTKDGRFVIMHDKTIERETTGEGEACTMTLSALKKLHKRYRDGSVSEERVATLDEFLRHGKGRVVYKADLKPGVSDHFAAVMEIVIQHDAMEDIVFRVPYKSADQFERYKDQGVPYAKSLLMFKVSSREQVDDIQKRFDPMMIHIEVDKSDPANRETLELIEYAASRGLLVQAHADGTAEDWDKMVAAGVRMFHTKQPLKVKEFVASLPATDAEIMIK